MAKKRESRKTTDARSSPEAEKPEFWLYTIGLFGCLFLAFLVYGPALNGPFLFDDSYLPMNIDGFHDRPLSVWVSGQRPLLMLSYWVNLQLAGPEPAQYHYWNVFLHFLNTTLLYFILRKLLRLADAPPMLALFGAGLFLLHPLQTESIAYIASRSEALSALFFLGAFALFLYRGSQAISWPAALGVLFVYAAAMATKEHTAVLPALLLLTDYFWNPGFTFEGIRRNWRLYAPLIVGGAIGAIGVFQQLAGSDSAGFKLKGLSWYEYLFTQFRVFFVYLRLFLFPAGLTVDYDFPISHSLFDRGAVIGLVGILVLLGAAWYFRRRYPLACYGFLAFAVILAPTSSVVPIKDPIAEHRLYIPIIGLVLVTIEVVRRLPISQKALSATLGAILLAAAVVTYQRNIVWSGAIPLWEDAVQKSPRQARAHFQLAYAYFAENRCQEADQQYRTYAQLEKPDYRMLLDWALVDNCLNKPDDALQKLQQAAGLDKTAHVYTQIAMIYAKTNKFDQALQALDVAQGLEPGFDPTYVYRGQIFQAKNDLPAAEKEFRQALALNPRNQQAAAALRQIQQHLRLRQ